MEQHPRLLADLVELTPGELCHVDAVDDDLAGIGDVALDSDRGIDFFIVSSHLIQRNAYGTAISLPVLL